MKAPARPELVIFDFDGTLADSLEWTMRTLNRVAVKHRYRQVSDEEIAMLRGRNNREIVKYLGVSKWRLPFIARDVRRLYAEALDEISLFHGISDMLSDLSAGGTRVAVVSSNSEVNIRRVLGPSQTFVTTFVGGASLFGKAAKLRGVVRKLGHEPRNVLAVGDEVRDIEAARSAGLPCAAVAWGSATPDLLRMSSPSLFFESVGEMHRYFTGSPSDPVAGRRLQKAE